VILRRALVASVLVTFPLAAPAQLVPCGEQGDTDTIASALTAIERSVDPCGESADLVATVENVRRCTVARYQICISSTADRNLFDRPTRFHPSDRRTITWNPELRSALDPDHGDDWPAMLRDPTASLVHELAHAAQDCAGLNPGEHELEAVRIENIYRRASGLPQRSGYGSEPLPVAMIMGCTPGECTCERPAGATQARAGAQPDGADASGRVQSSGDSIPPPGPALNSR
jgi:hypothetical protein